METTTNLLEASETEFNFCCVVAILVVRCRCSCCCFFHLQCFIVGRKESMLWTKKQNSFFFASKWFGTFVCVPGQLLLCHNYWNSLWRSEKVENIPLYFSIDECENTLYLISFCKQKKSIHMMYVYAQIQINEVI